MDTLKEIFNGLKERLSSPFFGAFTVSWLIWNWSIVICLFMFDTSMLHSKGWSTYLDCINGQIDTCRNLWYPLIFALVYLGFYPLFRGLLSVFNSWVTKQFSNWEMNVRKGTGIKVDSFIEMLTAHEEDKKTLKDRVEKSGEHFSNWQVEATKAKKLEAELIDKDETINIAKNDLSILTDLKEVLESKMKIRDDLNQELRDLISKQDKEIEGKQLELDVIRSDASKFKIDYAKYGSYGTYIEVTRDVSLEIESSGFLEVNKILFVLDPTPYRIKNLEIQYAFDGEKHGVNAIEGSRIVRAGNQLIVEDTPRSLELKKRREYQEQVKKLFSGQWQLDWGKSGEVSQSEDVTMNELGEYLRNGKVAFIIGVVSLNGSDLVIRKVTSNGRLHSKETLKVINEKEVIGSDSLGNSLRYSRKK